LYPILFLICCFIIFPFYWMVLSSLVGGKSFQYPPMYWPTNPSLDAYLSILFSGQRPIFLWLTNSTIIAVSTALTSTIVGSFAAYALSRYRFKGKSLIQQGLLLIRMVPGTLVIVPLYILFIKLNLNNTLFALVLTSTAFAIPLSIFMLKGYFDTISTDIEEAARVDGCGRLRILFMITLPLAAPGLVATTLYGFMWGWGEFTFANTLVSSGELTTMAVGLRSFQGENTIYWNEMMAASVLYTIPVSVVFLVLQKYLIAGLTAGAVKA